MIRSKLDHADKKRYHSVLSTQVCQSDTASLNVKSREVPDTEWRGSCRENVPLERSGSATFGSMAFPNSPAPTSGMPINPHRLAMR